MTLKSNKFILYRIPRGIALSFLLFNEEIYNIYSLTLYEELTCFADDT